MKKFFKALALVLALTLVIGTVPASAAATTIDKTKVKTAKTLYVDGTKGFKTEADGTVVNSKYQARTTYAKLLGISKKAAAELEVTAVSTDNDIVKANDKTQAIRAYGIGEETVTITADGSLYKVVVTAKKSASDGTVIFGRDFKDTDKTFYAGKTYELSLPRSSNGEKMDTDERRLFVKDADGNDITTDVAAAVEGQERLWTVKFAKAGTYTLTGEAFQSEKSYPGTTGTSSITVEVKIPELSSVKQTALNAFELTFDGDADVVDMSTFTEQDIYYVVADSVVPFSLLKSVSVNDDKSGVTVTMYGNFVGGTEYFVKVGDVTKSFVASGTAAEDIVALVVTSATVEYGDFRNIGYKYLNKEGIDITAANSTLYPVFELTSSNTNEVVVAGTQIYFYEKGKTANIKGSVTTSYGNQANNYTPTVIDTTATIVSTDQASASYLGVLYSFESTKYGSTTSVASRKAASSMGTVHDYAIGDETLLNIFFKYRNAADTADEYHTLADEGITRVAVSDENFMVVSSTGEAASGESYVSVTGIKPGNVQILLYKTNNEGVEYAYAAFPVTVKAARTLTSVSMTASKSNLNTQEDVNDCLTLTLTAKDQYGEGIIGLASDIVLSQTDVTITNVGTLNIKEAWSAGDSAGTYKYSVAASAFKFDTDKITDTAKGGSIVLSAKVSNKLTTNNVGIAIADKTEATPAYIPTISAATLDTAIATDTASKHASFGVEISKSGFYGGTTSAEFLGKTDFQKTAKPVSEGSFYYTVSYNGTLLDSATDIEAVASKYLDLENDVLTAAVGSSGSAITKAKSGTYVFTLYQGIVNGTTTTVKNLGAKTVVVSDSQIQPTWTTLKDVTSVTYTDDGSKIVNDTIEIKWNGTVYSAVSADVVKSSDSSYFIKTAKIRVYNAKSGDALEGAYVELTVTINKLINGSNK